MCFRARNNTFFTEKIGDRSKTVARWFVRFSPDSFRVISMDAEDSHPKFDPLGYRASFEPTTPVDRLFPDIDCRQTRVLPKPTADFRCHNPQSSSCAFIHTNVRLLNEPVCTVSWFNGSICFTEVALVLPLPYEFVSGWLPCSYCWWVTGTHIDSIFSMQTDWWLIDQFLDWLGFLFCPWT